MSDLQMWSLIVGALAPPVIAIIQQPRWAPGLRAVVTALLCLLLGAGTAFFVGDLNGRTFVSAFLVVLVAALATYTSFWKPTLVAPAVESATSPGSAPVTT